MLYISAVELKTVSYSHTYYICHEWYRSINVTHTHQRHSHTMIVSNSSHIDGSQRRQKKREISRQRCRYNNRQKL